MRIFFGLLVMSISLCAADVQDPQAPVPVMTSTYYGVRPGVLEKAKKLVEQGDKDALAALKSLTNSADSVLKTKPQAVTDKKYAGPSGDMHDYVSLAPYSWPNPDKPDGLPYITKDGQVNPESRDLDHSDGNRLIIAQRLKTVGLAYYFTGKEAYADWAINQARVWFIDEATRMNPHIKYAQLVRGSKKLDRKSGILDGRHLAMAVDALALVTNAKGWKSGERESIEEWAAKFFEWITTNELGKGESESTNNHGTYYDEQVARWAMHLGKVDFAKSVLENAKKKRIAAQIQPDGKQPRELERTNALSYSQFNIRGLCALAILGEYAGVDLWNYKSEDGRCITLAMDYLLPYLDVPAKEWPYKQITENKRKTPDLLPQLRMAALIMNKPEYEALVQRYKVNASFEIFLSGVK